MDKETKKIVTITEEIIFNLERGYLDRTYPLFRSTNLIFYFVSLLLVLGVAICFFLKIGDSDLLSSKVQKQAWISWAITVVWILYLYWQSRTIKGMPPKWRFINI